MWTSRLFSALYIAAAVWMTTTTAAVAAEDSDRPLARSHGLAITISPSLLIPNPDELPATTHAKLSKLTRREQSSQESPSSPSPPSLGDKIAYISPDNRIVFPDLTENENGPATVSYLLSIHSRDYTFMNYRVDVDVGGGSSDGKAGEVVGVWDVMRGFKWDLKSTNRLLNGHMRTNDGTFVLEAMPLAKRNFYEERPAFSPLSLLQSPMVLMGIFGTIVTIVLPKYLQNMDAETREQFTNTRAQLGQKAGPGTDATNAAGSFDFAAFMASKSSVASQSQGAVAASGRDEASGDSRRKGMKKR